MFIQLSEERHVFRFMERFMRIIKINIMSVRGAKTRRVGYCDHWDPGPYPPISSPLLLSVLHCVNEGQDLVVYILVVLDIMP